MSIEARVGGFVLAALIVLVGFVLVLGEVSLTPAVKLWVDFGYAGGLQQGAPVKASGVRVGRVADIALVGTKASPPPAEPVNEVGRRTPAVVRAKLLVDKQAAPLLTQGLKAYVTTQGILGEAYVELSPGPADSTALAPGSVVRGVDAPQVHVLAQKLGLVLGAVAALVGPDEQGELGPGGRALSSLVESLGSVVEERRADLITGLGDAAATANDLRAVSAELRRAVGDGRELRALLHDGSATVATMREHMPVLLGRADRALSRMEAVSTKLDDAIGANRLEEYGSRASHVLSYLENTSRDAQQVMSTLARGQGTLGGLIQDPQVFEDLRALLKDLKEHPWKLLWRD